MIDMNQYNQFQQLPFMQQQSNGVNWVSGVDGARAWQLAPNSNAIMLDRENDGIFYIKSSDNVGMCTIRVFKYEEVKPTQPQNQQIDLSEYVKKSELETYVNSLLGGGDKK